MRELSKTELINIKGGSALMITPLYGFIKVLKWITKFINSRF